MFKLGEYIVYPFHGIGKLVSIEKKKDKEIYKIRLEESQLMITIPSKSVKMMGIRKIISKTEVKKIIASLSKKPESYEDNWRLRFQKNIEKLKKGDIESMVSLIKELYVKSKKKPLSMIEKKQYEDSYKLLVYEISLTMKSKEKETSSLVSKELDKLV